MTAKKQQLTAEIEKETETASEITEDVGEKKLNTLERIQLLANLANGVQNETVKKTVTALPSGDRLYEIFINAVSQEIESLMNPSRTAPKEIMDAVTAAQNLRTIISHMYNAVAEMNRSQLIAVLSIMNQNLGGKSMPPLPNDRSQPQEQGPVEPPASGFRRSTNTGMSW